MGVVSVKKETLSHTLATREDILKMLRPRGGTMIINFNFNFENYFLKFNVNFASFLEN